LPKLYFEEVKKRYKLEEKAADLDNWQKIVDEREHPKLPRIKSEYVPHHVNPFRDQSSIKRPRKTMKNLTMRL
jgi:hypothetical protein